MYSEKIDAVARKFNFDGEIVKITPHGGGYINDTYAVSVKNLENGEISRYIMQRINHDIFKDVDGLMGNFRKVTDYLKDVIKAYGGDALRETLTIVPAKDGKDYVKDADGNYYRALLFIEDTITYETVKSANDFYKAAKAFGNFQRLLKDFPAETLVETIPNFHNTAKRYETFLKAVEENKSGRLDMVQKEVEFIKQRADATHALVDMLQEGKLPLKVTHNDTKLSNILMDAKTNEGLCVIDLDTIMPGLAAYDFGDSIRAGACWTAEDELDLEKVFVDFDLFDAYVKGFLEGAQDGLTNLEIRTLPLGAKTITLEQGIRFLTDFLDGDTYFKTQYPNHNLDRTRTQLKLVADMEMKWDELNRIVEKYIK